jgi:peroxiredoxin
MAVAAPRKGQKAVTPNQPAYLNWRILFVVAVVCLFGGMAAHSLFFAAPEQEAVQKPPEPPKPGEKLPGFTLIPLGQSLMSGQAFTNNDLIGHKTIFVIVKATCPHCLKECAWLSTFLPKLEGKASVVVASISPANETVEFAQTTGFSKDVYFNAGTLAMQTGIQAVPDLFLLDETGTVRYFHQGELDSQKLEALLNSFVRGEDLSQYAALYTKTPGGRA